MTQAVGSNEPPPPPDRRPAPEAIILAAGKGTRMGGDLPKVAYPVADRPMVWWVVQACQEASVARCIVVVGYRGEEVNKVLADRRDCVFVEQHEQLGTGHATLMASPLLGDGPARDVFVLPGDAPLIRGRTLRRLLETHRASDAAATLATSVLDDPAGYGRVIRDDDGSFQAIIEQKDATESQRRVREINAGYYCFRSDRLFDSLKQISNANAQGEYYLTDVPGMLKQAGETVAIIDGVPPQEVMGVNNPTQLAQVDLLLRERPVSSPRPDSHTRESA